MSGGKRKRRPSGSGGQPRPKPKPAAAPQPDDTGGSGYAGIKRSAKPASAKPTSAKPSPARGGGSTAKGSTTGRPRPRRDAPPPRSGRITDALRAASPYPGFFTSLASGAAIVASSPLLLGATLLVVAGAWLGLLALGLDQFPPAMSSLLSLPPVSSIVDARQLAGNLYPQTSSAVFVFALAMTAVRALVMAILAGWVVDVVRHGRGSVVGLLRGLRAYPAVLGVYLLNVAVLAGVGYLGVALGQLVQLLYPFFLLGSLLLLVFAPFVAVLDGSSLRRAVRKSVRAALLPGSRHLLLAMTYFLVSLLAAQSINPTGEVFTVNPTWEDWIVVLVANFVHMAFFAAFGYRYLVVEAMVPDVPLSLGRSRPQPPPRRRR